MALHLYPILIAGGILAGFINTLAGSGSLVTLPLLLLAGLPANIANGTNRVAIVLQNVVSTTRFSQMGIMDHPGALQIGLPMLLGSVAGAQIAVNLDAEVMRRVIGVIMVVMFFVILLRPTRWQLGVVERIEGRITVFQILLFFGMGIYGGFIQAGVGIFLLAGLVLAIGYDLVRANAVKVGVILLQALAALLVFIRNDQVVWQVGLVLAIGTMLGAQLATKMAVEKGAIWVRRLLIIIVAISALILLGFFDFALDILSGSPGFA